MRRSPAVETRRIIVTHTPPYVWGIFALLLFLGVRRLKPRRTHLALAALAPTGFFIWSIAAEGSLLVSGGGWAVVVTWTAAFLVGAMSGPVRTVPRPVHVDNWVFDYSATRLPLTFYMALFVTRYGLGIWAGFVPTMAGTVALLSVGLSALTAGRTLADFLPPLAVALRDRRAAARSA